MRLHGHPYSHNTRKVMVTAAPLGVDPDLRVVNLIAEESFAPAFKRLRPNGLTPVQGDGDLIRWEAGAIMQYLCGLQPGNELWPAENRARAEVDRRPCWNARHCDPAPDPIVIERMVKPLEGHPTDEASVERHLAWARALVPILEDPLTGRDCVAGPSFTLADIALASLVRSTTRSRSCRWRGATRSGPGTAASPSSPPGPRRSPNGG